MTEPQIFISFAQADASLGRHVKSLLIQGGVPARRIVFSGDRSTGVPTGANFKQHLRSTVSNASLIVQLLTPTFYWRQFCLAEMGAQWVLDANAFPMRVPSLDDDALGFLGDVHVARLDDDATLWELHERVELALSVQIYPSVWRDAVADFLNGLPSVLEGLAPAPVVERNEHLDAIAEVASKAELQLRAAAALIDRFTRLEVDDCSETERYEYFVGSQPSDDSVRCEFTTSAIDEPVLVRVLEIGATPYAGKTVQPETFAEANLRLFCSHPGTSVALVPIVEGPAVRRLRGVVSFDPPIEPGTPVAWGYDLIWPGMWDRLRETGHDTHESVLEGTRAAKVEVIWHFPYESTRIRVTPPDIGTIDRPGTRTLRWFVEKPRSGEHIFSLRVAPEA